MSDSLEEFRRKNEAQFERWERFVYEVAVTFVIQIAKRLVLETSGFENQKPNTAYIPTGRLRGGYYVSDVPIGLATNWTGGPFSDYGVETVEKIRSDIESRFKRRSIRSFYIVNNTGYGYMVEQGLEVHADRPNPATKRVSAGTTQANALAEALSMVRVA